MCVCRFVGVGCTYVDRVCISGACFMKRIIDNKCHISMTCDKSTPSQSKLRISVAYNNYCILLLITSVMIQGPRCACMVSGCEGSGWK